MCCTCLAFYVLSLCSKRSWVSIWTEIMNLISVEWILLRWADDRKLTCFQFYCCSIFVLNRIMQNPYIISNGWIIIIFPSCLIICHQHRVVTSEVCFVRCNLRFMQLWSENRNGNCYKKLWTVWDYYNRIYNGSSNNLYICRIH